MFKDDSTSNHEYRGTLSGVPDLAIIKEAAERLQKAFCKEFGVEMRYGSFHFVYHDGQLRQVEDHPKNRRFLLVSKRQFANGVSANPKVTHFHQIASDRYTSKYHFEGIPG